MRARRIGDLGVLERSLTELVSDSMDAYNWKGSNGSPIPPINPKCPTDRQLHTDLSLEANHVTLVLLVFTRTCEKLILPITPLTNQRSCVPAAPPTLEMNDSESLP